MLSPMLSHSSSPSLASSPFPLVAPPSASRFARLGSKLLVAGRFVLLAGSSQAGGQKTTLKERRADVEEACAADSELLLTCSAACVLHE